MKPCLAEIVPLSFEWHMLNKILVPRVGSLFFWSFEAKESSDISLCPLIPSSEKHSLKKITTSYMALELVP